MSLLGSTFNIQRTLSTAQTTPIVGPLVVSPCKALVSLVQIVVGIASGIFFGSLAALGCGNRDWNNWFGEKTLEATGQAGLGLLAFGYSLLNIFTFGIAGHKIESGQWAKDNPKIRTV